MRVRSDGANVSALDGLTGTIDRPHDIARDWVWVRIDPNPALDHHEWPVPLRRLEKLANAFARVAL